MVEAIAGVGAATLAILGLAGVLPFYTTTLATIAVGAGLFAEGSSLGAAAARIDRETSGYRVGSGGAFGVQAMAGAVGIVLGILALVGVLPSVLVPVAILAMGGGMVLAGPGRAELNLGALELGGASPRARRRAAAAVQTSGRLLGLVGLGAVTLAILELAGVGTGFSLELVALLGLGVALVLGSSALLGRLMVTAR